MIEIPYPNNDLFAKYAFIAGGYIVFKAYGSPIIRFDDEESFLKYMRLKKQGVRQNEKTEN